MLGVVRLPEGFIRGISEAEAGDGEGGDEVAASQVTAQGQHPYLSRRKKNINRCTAYAALKKVPSGAQFLWLQKIRLNQIFGCGF